MRVLSQAKPGGRQKRKNEQTNHKLHTPKPSFCASLHLTNSTS